MGGKTLEHLGLRRLSATEIKSFSEKVIGQLNGLRLFEEIKLVPSYASTESFGDIDLLLSAQPDNVPDDWVEHWIEQIVEAFTSRGYLLNGKVLSIESSNFQVDLILTAKELFEMKLAYLSYNDLGNLMGRIAYMMGLKLGEDGLTWPLRDGDALIGTIKLTSNPEEAFKFLGYVYQRFCQGFESVEDIFRFVVSTQFFNHDAFRFEQQNHRQRKRLKTRETYPRFTEWLSRNQTLAQKDVDFPEDGCWASYIYDYFPSAENSVQDAYESLARRRLIKSRVNSSLVQRLTGLSGAPLGEFMDHFRKSFGCRHDYEEAILQSSAPHIERLIFESFAAYRNEA